MNRLNDLERRVGELECALNAAIGVLNGLIEAIYEPEFVKKLDKLSEYGEKVNKE